MKKMLAFLFLFTTINANAVSIDEIYKHIKTVNNSEYEKYDGITFSKPSINALRNDGKFLFQTPQLWGHTLKEYNQSRVWSKTGKYDPVFNLPTCFSDNDCGHLSKCATAFFTKSDEKLCLMPEDNILNRLATNISGANYSVDIFTLGLYTITSGAFTDTIKNALYKLAEKSIRMNHTIKIRMLEGNYIPFTKQLKLVRGANPSPELNGSLITLYGYLKNLTKDLPKKNKLIISVASMTGCLPSICPYKQDPMFSFSWNHGKAVIIDNKDLMTGGQNFNADEYLGENPTNDSMIELIGPIAQTAEKYADVLWKYVDSHPRGGIENHCFTYMNGKINNICLLTLSKADFSVTPNVVESNHLPFKIETMSVSKLDHGILPSDADQSEIARVYAFKNAIKTIKISQQALFVKSIFKKVIPPFETPDGNVISALAYAIYAHNVDVKIITSNFSKSLTGFTSFVRLKYIYTSIKNSIKSQFPSASDIEITGKLNKLLHLAYISFNANNNKIIANHNKFWMVDDHLFYFGSHNIYPTALQQYGIIVDNKALAQNILINFWNPMWKNSNKKY